MKKNIAIIMGIAFALFIGGTAISCGGNDYDANSDGFITPEEAMTAYAVDQYPECDIEDVEVYDISSCGNGGSEYVMAFVTADGEVFGLSVPSSTLAEYGF